MKKIILIIIILLCTACYDYKEINDLSFVSTIALSYDEKYNIEIEVLNSDNETFIMKSEGKTITECFDNMNISLSKIPYYYHLKSVIIDENIAKDHIQEFLDYMVREIDIRNEFYLVVSPTPSKIINYKQEETSSVGKYITKLIETNKYDYNSAYNKVFEDVFEKFENQNLDAITTYITFDEDKIKISGMALFHDYKYVGSLNTDDSASLNILNNEVNNQNLLNYYDDKAFVLNIYSSNVDIKFDNKKVDISFKGEALVKENETNIDLENEDNYKKLQSDFEKILKDKFNEIISILKEKNADALGLKNKYFIKYHKKVEDINEFDINIDCKININKKGLIFEVQDEK